MKNSSSPGPDDIPNEFYKMFWLKKDHLVASYDFSSQYDWTKQAADEDCKTRVTKACELALPHHSRVTKNPKQPVMTISDAQFSDTGRYFCFKDDHRTKFIDLEVLGNKHNNANRNNNNTNK
ncbi:hypothetical protein ElyMa_005006400 [Elysia marginata]|uniref:Uncharacterized protein n=1 Tax=Elysia marginata TaxID=1093978 RepID=A0AAV4J6K9_9GAST|nr:hypothetical protein ElyMa_005006400 [Elysia marginata]